MGVSKRVQARTIDALSNSIHRLIETPHAYTAQKANKISNFIVKYCPTTSAIDMRNMDFVQLPSVRAIIDRCPNLTYYAMPYFAPKSDVEPIPMISQALPHLTCLCLDTHITHTVVHEIATHLPKLRALQLGQFNIDSNFDAHDMARILDRCADMEVLVFLSKRCFVEQLCRHTKRVADLKTLGAPYSFVNDESIRALQEVRALESKIELNFGCDYLTFAGLKIVFKSCTNLLVLSFTSASPIDFTQALALLCDKANLPKLQKLGIRARERADPRTLVDFHRFRPEVELYNYRVKRFCGRWCFKAFDFYKVCCRAGIIHNAQ